MQWRNGERSWGAMAKLLHWSMAALMIYGSILAVYIVNQEEGIEENALRYIAWIKVHKSVGLTIFLLVVLRLVWLKRNPRPDIVAHASAAERRASHAAHVSLYALMIVLPIIGFFSSNSVGASTHFWYVIEVPNVFPADRDVAEAFAALGVSMPAWIPAELSWARVWHTLHWTLGYFAMTLIALHVAAALFHHYARRDRVLTAMLPAVRAERPRQEAV